MISLKGVSKSYNQQTKVVDDLNLEINDGELVVLVGESGCGKTTTMKMINRLIEPTSGDIFIDGKNIKSLNKNELRRNIGYVIQNIGLLPHQTIEKNIATVPLLCKKDKGEVKARVHELLDLIELPYDIYASRYPRELSGGQQQRIGVARALANNPDIILMDEPFSALDPITREQLQNELLKLQVELHKTIVFVTHDIDEALKLGDRIAVMADGNILQYDTPENILKHPVNDYVEAFVGTDRLWKTPDMLKAKEVMNKKIIKIGADRPILHAIELMKEHDTNILIVVENASSKSSKMLGILGINRLKGVSNPATKVRDIMKVDVIKIPQDMSLVEVLNIRKENGIQYSPVMDVAGNIIGIITNTSIINVLTDIVPDKEEY
ncbi:MAG: proline/glycine betaine ABC transporter ATP-binding protein [Firmicutes bacterium HGW-Firmicutes-2]|nr:MAG: proline/glycine betaine ABC transporter ATP-binding protein [Firmicutes bacterium HGW-Firmicutes-2]